MERAEAEVGNGDAVYHAAGRNVEPAARVYHCPVGNPAGRYEHAAVVVDRNPVRHASGRDVQKREIAADRRVVRRTAVEDVHASCRIEVVAEAVDRGADRGAAR